MKIIMFFVYLESVCTLFKAQSSVPKIYRAVYVHIYVYICTRDVYTQMYHCTGTNTSFFTIPHQNATHKEF